MDMESRMAAVAISVSAAVFFCDEPRGFFSLRLLGASPTSVPLVMANTWPVDCVLPASVGDSG